MKFSATSYLEQQYSGGCGGSGGGGVALVIIEIMPLVAGDDAGDARMPTISQDQTSP